MSRTVDILHRIQNITLSFELPIDLWDSLQEDVKMKIASGWENIKFLNEAGDAINENFNLVPNDCGGIYVFLLKPDLIADMHRYIMYIGRARRQENFSLRKRCRTYFSDKERPRVANMIETWGKKLYLYYLPIRESDDVIERIEKELLRVIRPPCNSQLPQYYIGESKNLFGGE